MQVHGAGKRRGTGAFGRVYSTWALSQAWFRARSWERLGFASCEDYLREAWEERMAQWDAHDLLCMLGTWQRGDISRLSAAGSNDEDTQGGDRLAAALGRIEARVLVMPSRTDMYFPPEDSEEEVRHLRRGELRVIESIWGHIAGGGGGTKEDNEFIKAEVKKFMAS